MISCITMLPKADIMRLPWFSPAISVQKSFITAKHRESRNSFDFAHYIILSDRRESTGNGETDHTCGCSLHFEHYLVFSDRWEIMRNEPSPVRDDLSISRTISSSLTGERVREMERRAILRKACYGALFARRLRSPQWCSSNYRCGAEKDSLGSAHYLADQTERDCA